MQIKLLVAAGNAKPGPSLSQQLGPLGINLGKLIAEVNKASAKFKGMKVPAVVDIDPEKKTFTITIKTPPTSELIKKELGLEKGASDSKVKVANMAVEQAVKIAKEKQDDMIVNSFKSAVKNVIATCTSLGVIVEGKEPKEISKEIDAGKFDDIINNQVTEMSAEKKEMIDSQFAQITEIAEKKRKAEEAEKAAEEAKKAKAEEEEKAAEEPKEGEEKAEEEKKEGEEKAEAKPAKEAKGKK